MRLQKRAFGRIRSWPVRLLNFSSALFTNHKNHKNYTICFVFLEFLTLERSWRLARSRPYYRAAEKNWLKLQRFCSCSSRHSLSTVFIATVYSVYTATIFALIWEQIFLGAVLTVCRFRLNGVFADVWMALHLVLLDAPPKSLMELYRTTFDLRWIAPIEDPCKQPA